MRESEQIQKRHFGKGKTKVRGSVGVGPIGAEWELGHATALSHSQNS